MTKNTDIGPNEHAPCVEPTPPKKITPEDIPSEKPAPSDSSNWENVPDKPELWKIQIRRYLIRKN